MKKPLKVLLVGIGGYGNLYASEVLKNLEQQNLEISGVVDPAAASSGSYLKLKELGVPFYDNIDEFYSKNKADLAVISSPIQYHSYQSCKAMLNGSNVLCEKPMSGSVRDALKMIETRNQTGKLLAIGYQRAYSTAVSNLKKDILEGKFGKPKRCKAITFAPRDKSYYARNSWAGKLCDNQGNWIRDSVTNNATAHYLHILFYLLGESLYESIMPKVVEAELYRANPIESFDTSAVRVLTEGEIELMYYATHAVNGSHQAKLTIEFEYANVILDTNVDPAIKVVKNDGSVKVYGNMDDNYEYKLWCIIDAIRGKAQIACGAEAALPQTICIEAMHASMEILDFPSELIKFDEENNIVWVRGLMEELDSSYENWALPSEMNLPWAGKGKKISV